ncbi:MAG: Protein RarD [Steroidobacteraceae bacterium]|nr:Protein RarD [Steroidobacteraceae bacterium]
MGRSPPADRRGYAAAISAYAIWGLFPLYWYQLKAVPAVQIVAHRVVWCAVFVVGWLALRGESGWLRRALAAPRVLPMLVASSVLISVNWGIYIWAVTHGRVLDASLGYFIGPLANVLVGVLWLRERLSGPQWIAVGCAALGVMWLTARFGEPPWVALTLAASFCLYGLIRKLVAVESMPGLAIESLILLLPALGWLGFSEWRGVGAFGHGGAWRDALLVFGGALTALPLLGFAYGARRLPYSVLGLLQYLAPTLQMLCGLLFLGEAFTYDRLLGFACIWLGLVVFAADGWFGARHLPASG